MPPIWSIFFSIREAPDLLRRNALYFETHSTVQKLLFDNTEDACPFIAYCVTEFEIICCCLIFIRFLF